MWASAPTEVCCGRHRPAKMLRRGGACPRPRAAIKAAPTSGVPSSAGYLAALGRRGGPMWASAPTEAVSYTHLDVYKRQMWYPSDTYFIDSYTGFLGQSYFNDAPIFRTTDGGLTWEEITLPLAGEWSPFKGNWMSI